jgi:nucleoside-diphosphate-sugar epimerase
MGAILEELDVTDGDQAARLVKEVSPDVVFHLAAPGVMDRSVPDGELLAGHLMGTHCMLEAAEASSVGRFVHVGGSSEYGHHDHPLAEETSLQPVTPYGAAKAAASLLALQKGTSERLNVVVLRPFSIYGPGEPRTRLLPSAIAAALGDEVLPLTVPGISRDYVYVDDVADALIAAADPGLASGAVYNVGTGIMTTNEELVGLVGAVLGKQIRVEVGAYPSRASDTRTWVADTGRATQELGWTAHTALAEGIASTAEWLRRDGEISARA